MATPEQNTLLGLQLFQPATNVIVNDNQQRTSLLARIAETLNEQRFKQQQATQAQGNAVTLENLRAANSQALADKSADRQAMLSDKSTERQYALADKSFDRQMTVSKQAQDARDIAELHKQFALAYPEYRKAANVAGIEPYDMSEFEQSWEGLGELKAEFGDAITAADAKKNSLAATVALGSARMAYHNLSVAMAATDEAGKLSETEQAAIKNAGLTALQGAKDMGSIKGVDDAQFASGLAALAGDEPEAAKKTFGKQFSAIKALYDRGQERARMMIVNSPEHKAEVANRIHQEGIAMQGVNRELTGLATMAAKNPEIGAQYGQFQQDVTALQQQRSQRQPAAGNAQSVFDTLVAPKPAPAPPPVAPQPGGGFLSRLFNPAPAAQSPGASIFGPMSFGGTPQPVAPPVAAPAAAPDLSALRALAPPVPAPLTTQPPPEVQQAAALVANSRIGAGTEPYKQLIRAWLDNNGIGRPYSDENTQLRRLIDLVPAQ